MTKVEIKEIVASCMNEKTICRIFLRYDISYRYYIPLFISDKLFLGAEEDDFIIDGYHIRRFKDITKAQIKDDMCIEILKREGVIDRITTPDVDITSWETVFRSLQKRMENIIVEKEDPDEKKCKFVIGRIEKIYKNYAYVRHFDADGIWQEEPYRIPYTEITSITFDSRYVNTYSKYLGSLPDNSDK